LLEQEGFCRKRVLHSVTRREKSAQFFPNIAQIDFVLEEITGQNLEI
jgi:hypothetical protein